MSTLRPIAEAAKQIGLSVQQTRSLCRSGKLAAEKVGRSWVIEQTQIDGYLAQMNRKEVEDHPRYSISAAKKPIMLSFFSGAMGLDLGFETAGFENLLACEIDKACRETIRINRPDIALLGDLLDQDVDTILKSAGCTRTTDIDLIAGGPPCQAFSTAGKRRGFSDDRGNVFLTYVSIALEIRPKFIVIENVRGLLSCPLAHRPHDQRGKGFPPLGEDELKGGALNFVLNRIRSSGYSFSFNLYNSANFGTPQKRERVIIICSRDGSKLPHLQPTHSENGEFDLPRWRTFADAVQGLKNKNLTYLKFPESRLRYYRMLGPGENWRNLPPDLQEKALGNSYFAGGGKTGFFRRLAWDKPAPTLVTHPAMPATDLGHPTEDRPLSVEEYKILQEFPDDWKITGGIVQQYKQIGNAVPCSLGKAVGKLLVDHLNGHLPVTYPGFRYSRYQNTDETTWEQEFRKHVATEKGSDLQQALPF